MRLISPYFLILLILVFIFVWLQRKRIRRGTLWVRVASMILLILSLAQPQLVRKDDSIDLVFALDTSQSISPHSREEGLRFIEESLMSKKERDRVGFIVFGEEAITQRPLGYDLPIEIVSSPSSKGTNIERAIRLSNILLSQSTKTNKRIVLITDGNETDGSAIDSAYDSRDQGIRIDVLPVLKENTEETAIDDIVVPREVKLGEPFIIKTILTSSINQKVRLDIFQDDEKIISQELPVRYGKNLSLFSITPNKPGFHKFRVEIFPQRDSRIENNVIEAFTVVEGPPKILYAYNPKSGYGKVLTALKTQGINLEVVSPGSLPDTMVGFSGYSTLVLDNVPATMLTLDQMRAIQSFVRDAGGGLLVIGGPESFGMGSYDRTPLEETLPVESKIIQSASLSNIALVLIIDASGSMSGQEGELSKMELAKESAQLVVDLLKDQDKVGVIAFDHSYQWIVELTNAGDKKGIASKISKVQPGGGTAMYPPMESAYEVLKNEKARVRHIIVLSDGQTEPGNFKSLVEKMRLSDITVSTIAIGSDADINLMRRIAEWGNGRFYYTNDIYSVPQIFLTETLTKSRPYIVEKEFSPILNEYMDFLNGIDRLPNFLGYVSTSLKPKAKQLMSALEDEPLLAYWRYGLGKVIAFTSDSGNRWTKVWTSKGSFSRFWSQTVRWLGQDTHNYHVDISTYQRSGKTHIVVDIFDINGRFVNFLEGSFTVLSPSGRLTQGRLTQIDPGRYHGVLESREEGIYSVSIQFNKDGIKVNGMSGFYVPISKELRDVKSNTSLLYSLTEITSGRILDGPKDVFSEKARTHNIEYTDIWQLFLLLSGLLFITELVFRKLPAILEQSLVVLNLINSLSSLRSKFKIPSESLAKYENSYEESSLNLKDHQSEKRADIESFGMEHAARLYIARLKQEREQSKGKR